MVSLIRAWTWSAARAPRLPVWTIDRNWDRAEGERLLKDQQYGEASYHLGLAVEEVSREGIRLEASLPHPDPMRMARRVHRLGIARYKTGDSEDAIPALERGLEVHEQAYGMRHDE